APSARRPPRVGEGAPQAAPETRGAEPPLTGAHARERCVVETARGADRAGEPPEDRVDELLLLGAGGLVGFAPRRAEVFERAGLGDQEARTEPAQRLDGDGPDAD